MKEKGSESV
ncbi:hypothetical protein E2C01_096831 [Portunus trituberculatus]|uniref:Uncharacterized protein n=1 Tax=Portunus trituberculatus TaxID=210409 RepID=A0A5B7JWM9_PORTR|nr:hypothetical protein [Portunus trituberculatus]